MSDPNKLHADLLAAEFEAAQAHIAQLLEAVGEAAVSLGSTPKLDALLTDARSDWLDKKLQEARDAALEDAACTIEENTQDIAWRGLDDAIRAMKGDKE